ncbi:MAG: NAD(P)/FAD-dependent oxidoreductase [Asgard group archaeon]|nr:NAD(P)/FAD-dependent oxidoreductase [Asgard group archaeon]
MNHLVLKKLKETILLYDVAIIGGGIAGLTAATLLGKRGYKVVVLEKHKTIGACNKLQMQGFPAFEIPNLPFRVPPNYKVTQAKIWSPNRSIIPMTFENPILYLQYRGPENSIDTFLYNLALKAGADIIPSSEVRKLGNGKLINEIITTNNETYKARCILVANGASNRFRRFFDIDLLEPKGIGLGAVVENIDINPNEIHGAFSQKIAPMGYSYVIGHSDGTATVAMSARPRYLVKKSSEYLEKTMKFFQPILKDSKKISSFSGIVTCNDKAQTLVHKNVLFIGEAGGFQDPMFGFGMAPSMKSAEIAVKIIEDALITNNDNIYLEKLNKFNKNTMMKELHRKIKLGIFARKAILENISDAQLESIIPLLKGKGKQIEKILIHGTKYILPTSISILITRPFLLRYLFKSIRYIVRSRKNHQ